MASESGKTGQRGEKEAVSYLKKKGYKILKTNFRTRFAELDIIARDRNTLCFIEVKARRSLKTGLPKEAVTATKQKKIILAATSYLKDSDLFDSEIRFDVVEVFFTHDKISVNLIKNAFQAD